MLKPACVSSSSHLITASQHPATNSFVLSSSSSASSSSSSSSPPTYANNTTAVASGNVTLVCASTNHQTKHNTSTPVAVQQPSQGRFIIKKLSDSELLRSETVRQNINTESEIQINENQKNIANVGANIITGKLFGPLNEYDYESDMLFLFSNLKMYTLNCYN